MTQNDGKSEGDEALEGFEALKDKIFKERGLDTSQYKDKFLKRRFRTRMRAKGVETYRQYSDLLDADPEEYARLYEKLTINVTEFFRNPEMWEAFRKKVLPKVLSDPTSKRIVRFWSAGCSSGEEVYTVAMLVDQYLWNKKSQLQVVIRGTDLDEEALKVARKGVYPAERVRKVPEIFRRLYLRSRADDSFEVTDGIKDMVRLTRHNLIGGRQYRYFDVIICRNVIIYFTKEQQNILFRSFHKALTRNGFLIIGKTETLMGEVKKIFDPVDSRERIYEKV